VFITVRSVLAAVLGQRSVGSLELKRFGIRVASLPTRPCTKRGTVLAARADLPRRSSVVRSFLRKVGPVERIASLVNLGLPGVPLRGLPAPPRQVPYHAGYQYFEIESGSELWKQLRAAGGVAVHVAGEFPRLQLELWAIRG
jgi:type VI secretion system protein ImpJ